MEPAEIPAAWLEMIRAGDRAAFAELSVPELVCHGPGGSSSGRAEFLGWLDWYGTAFADLEIPRQLGGQIMVAAQSEASEA
jgi:hypothetical protein